MTLSDIESVYHPAAIEAVVGGDLPDLARVSIVLVIFPCLLPMAGNYQDHALLLMAGNYQDLMHDSCKAGSYRTSGMPLEGA